jgi:hypothetical protein
MTALKSWPSNSLAVCAELANGGYTMFNPHQFAPIDTTGEEDGASDYLLCAKRAGYSP